MSRRGTREGSIYRRSDGYWAGAISLGAGQRKVIYGKTRSAVAENLKTLLKADQDGIILRSSDRLTVGAYLMTWIDGARANVRASTWIRYEEPCASTWSRGSDTSCSRSSRPPT